MDLATITLGRGNHPPNDGVCVMEAVALFAGEKHSDHPACASPVITAFAMRLNDRWDDETRQRLIPFIPRIVGTRDDALEDARRYLAVDWAVRVLAPRWLRKAGVDDHAKALEALPELTDRAVVKRAQRVIDDARSAAWGKRSAALAQVRAAVTEELKKKGVEPSVADAAAVAVADAVAVAVAAADAVAVAAADAVAVAAADAVAAAAAVAAADAVAVAAADAVAVAADWQRRDAIYAAVYKVFRQRFEAIHAEAIRESQDDALALLDRMIAVGRVAVPA